VNIALPALVIILGLLPGIVFFHGYFSGRFPKQIAAVSGVSELALYIIFAVPLGAFWLAVTSRLGFQPDYSLLGRLILGQDSTGTVGADLTSDLRGTWALTATVYTLVLIASFLAGNVLRKLVWTLRIDIRVPFLRMKHEWYYTLQGRLPALPRQIVPFADVLIEHAHTTQLYQGIVSSFEVNREGGISQLMLRETYKDEGKDAPNRWKLIPGDRFIVMGPAIRSINMRYFVIEPAEPEAPKNRTARARARWQAMKSLIRHLSRSFMFEEP
jgi:hypothetical protein